MQPQKLVHDIDCCVGPPAQQPREVGGGQVWWERIEGGERESIKIPDPNAYSEPASTTIAKTASTPEMHADTVWGTRMKAA